MAVAILRGTHARHLAPAAETLHAEGFPVLEYPPTTPGELEALHAARQRLGDAALVGAGTVLDADDARAALHAAQLLVSPILAPDVMTAGVEAGVAVLPGAFTPTEIVAAGTAGARLVKLFPTAVFGPGV